MDNLSCQTGSAMVLNRLGVVWFRSYQDKSIRGLQIVSWAVEGRSDAYVWRALIDPWWNYSFVPLLCITMYEMFIILWVVFKRGVVWVSSSYLTESFATLNFLKKHVLPVSAWAAGLGLGSIKFIFGLVETGPGLVVCASWSLQSW